jgi:hypothetical protein
MVFKYEDTNYTQKNNARKWKRHENPKFFTPERATSRRTASPHHLN